MTITAITGFCGRHRHVERIIRHYLDQDYKGDSFLLLYNNSSKPQILDKSVENRGIILVNNHIDKQTGEEYTNTGAIFRDALTFVPESTHIVTFMDSDDNFLPSHMSSGGEGMKRAKNLGCLAYKPYYSYFLYENKCRLLHNTLEPSIFVDYKYIKSEGFHPQPCSYHQKWLDVLIARKQLFVDTAGTPTLMYNWEQGHGNHKISGMGDDEHNFEAHRKWEREYGDGVLTPASPMEVEKYYTLARGTKLETA